MTTLADVINVPVSLNNVLFFAVDQQQSMLSHASNSSTLKHYTCVCPTCVAVSVDRNEFIVVCQSLISEALSTSQ